jgi:hypothetical protein
MTLSMNQSLANHIVINGKNSLKEKYNSYEPKNIFNINETGIFWRLPQNKTFITRRISERL